ncbi:MAG: alpha/beta hydrolase [Neomegalonema sp.]|nr:alpha/beta hydrolase [Neomegalonema sp.]
MQRRSFVTGSAAALLAGLTGRRTHAAPSLDLADYPPIGAILKVNGLDVHAAQAGSGGTPLVLLHGASVNLRDWTFSLMPRLARRRQVVAFDRPGFGYSTRDGADWGPSEQAAQLRRAARSLGIEKPIIIGHSWGAMVALAWALDAPREVTGVVTVSGATMPWGWAVNALDQVGIGRLGVEWYIGNLARGAGSGAIEAFATRAFMPQKIPRGYLDYIGAPLSLRPSALAANADDLARTHSALQVQSERYAGMAVPVQILHGDRDWLVTINRHAHALAERLPDAQVQVAPGVGHMAHHARPDLLERAIDRLSGAQWV